MNILVTGGTGRVGRSLVESLLREDNRVCSLDVRLSDRLPKSVQQIVGSLNDEETLRQIPRETEVVVHLAAFMSWLKKDEAQVYESNVSGTMTLMRHMRSLLTPRKVIFISSGEVYPEGAPHYLPIDEAHPREPRSLYGLSKLLGEEIVSWFHRTSGIPTTILRISHTQDAKELLDPDSPMSGPRFFLSRKIRLASALGQTANVEALQKVETGVEKLVVSLGEDGTPYRMHIGETRDIVHGIECALHAESANLGVFNIGPDTPMDFDEWIPRMAEMTGLECVRVRLSGKAVRYTTSNLLAKQKIGFTPSWDFGRMVAEAASAWNQRNTSKP